MEAVAFVQLATDGDFDGANVFLWTYPSEFTMFGAIPSLSDVSLTPAVIDPGRSLGQRASLTVSFTDHLHKFDTDEFDAGTFWTKFRARYTNLQGLPIRIYRGERGDALADMEMRQYVVDSYQLTDMGASITAKDVLTLVFGDAAQAPRVSEGELLGAIDADDTTATLTPSGIGDLKYPSSGYAVIGGNELVSFGRAGDTLTLSRGLNLGGVGVAHDADSLVQLAIRYNGAEPSAIIYDLLTTYTDIDPDWITLADWETDVDDYIGRIYSAYIPAPTSVSKLLDELCEQIGITLYWDDAAQQLRMKPLAPPSSVYTANAGNVLQGSFSVEEQPDKRVSEVWTYYGQRDVTRPLDEEANYRRVAVTIADNETDYQQTAIKKIYSRWIPLDNQSAALRVNDMFLARYKVPPRKFTFSLFRTGETLPKLANLVTIGHWRLVDTMGVEVTAAAQITSESGKDDMVQYSAEEALYDASIDTTKYVYIDADAKCINLRDRYDSTYASVSSADDVVFIIQSAVRIGANWVNGGITPDFTQAFARNSWCAVQVGDWPEGPNSLTLVNNGTIRSSGGAGAVANVPADHGGGGGLGLYTRVAISIVNNGEISGGGGGGGASAPYGGGGGAGFSLNGLNVQDYAPGGPGNPNVGYPASPPAGAPGGETTGGAGGGGTAGAGGNLGAAGTNGAVNNGGAAGPAVDGDSYVTWTTLGTINGSRIN